MINDLFYVGRGVCNFQELHEKNFLPFSILGQLAPGDTKKQSSPALFSALLSGLYVCGRGSSCSSIANRALRNHQTESP